MTTWTFKHQEVTQCKEQLGIFDFIEYFKEDNKLTCVS